VSKEKLLSRYSPMDESWLEAISDTRMPKNEWSGYIDRTSLVEIVCPVCGIAMRGNVLWHLWQYHNIECRSSEGPDEYRCCCSVFRTDDLEAFYNHFSEHGKDCVLTYLMSRKT
jgi:hypothetical protein